MDKEGAAKMAATPVHFDYLTDPLGDRVVKHCPLPIMRAISV